jgi:cytochrome bd-type quinol oxidase subunit 2
MKKNKEKEEKNNLLLQKRSYNDAQTAKVSHCILATAFIIRMCNPVFMRLKSDMQGEDDLRGLAKIMAFMRAVSIILVLMHLYWFCYGFFAHQQWTLELINKILYNFNKTAGLFSQPIYSKLFAIVLLALSCLGTKESKMKRSLGKKLVLVFLLVLSYSF